MSSFPDDYQVDRLEGQGGRLRGHRRRRSARPRRREAERRPGRAPGHGRPRRAQGRPARGTSTWPPALDRVAASRFKLKRALLDVLDTGHDIPCRARMVQAEFNGIWQQVEKDRAEGQTFPEDAGKTSDEELPVAEYGKIGCRTAVSASVSCSPRSARRESINVTEAELGDAMPWAEATRYEQPRPRRYSTFCGPQPRHPGPDARTALRGESRRLHRRPRHRDRAGGVPRRICSARTTMPEGATERLEAAGRDAKAEPQSRAEAEAESRRRPRLSPRLHPEPGGGRRPPRRPPPPSRPPRRRPRRRSARRPSPRPSRQASRDQALRRPRRRAISSANSQQGLHDHERPFHHLPQPRPRPWWSSSRAAASALSTSFRAAAARAGGVPQRTGSRMASRR